MTLYLGIACILGGIYFLLVNLNIIKKKSATSDKPKEAVRIDNILIRIASVALCVLGIYLIWPASEPEQKTTSAASPFKSATTKNMNVWNNELKEILIKQCLENGKKTSEKYPELVIDYCKCATEKITLAMTPEDYTQWMEKPMDQQAPHIRPIVQTCADIMNKLIQLTQEARPNRNEIKHE